MSETRVSEPKVVAGLKTRKVSRNRKNYGVITYEAPSASGDKIVIYKTTRKLDQYHRLTVGWLVEADTISAIKLYGVTHVLIEVENGVKLLMPIEVFGPEGLAQGVVRAKSNTYVDPWGRRGAICWHIPESLMAKAEPDEYVMVENLLARMHIKRDRSRKTVEEALASP
jgi:hypothetical protein